MDQSKLQHLTDEQRQTYRVLEQLYTSEGWKLIVKFAEAERAMQAQRMINARSWDEHNHAKGAYDAYFVFVTMADQFEAEYAAMAEEAADRVVFHEEGSFE